MDAYLDWNAAAPLRPEARTALVEALESLARAPGHPDAPHAAGRAARRMLEDARARVAEVLGAAPERVTFTAGAGDANRRAAAAARAVARTQGRPTTGVVTAGEHPALTEAITGEPRTATEHVADPAAADDGALTPAPGADLRPDPEALAAAAHRTGACVVGVGEAHSETGLCADVPALATALAAGHDGPSPVLVRDATQAAGRVPVPGPGPREALVIGGAKLGAPAGTGCLVRGHEVPAPPGRAGTPDVPGAAALAAALEAAVDALERDAAAMGALLDRLRAGLSRLPPPLSVWGDGPRVPNTALLRLPADHPVCGHGDRLAAALDARGVCVSPGSACESGAGEPNRLLLAAGVPEREARACLRVSWGATTTAAEVDALLAALTDLTSGGRNSARDAGSDNSHGA